MFFITTVILLNYRCSSIRNRIHFLSNICISFVLWKFMFALIFMQWELVWRWGGWPTTTCCAACFKGHLPTIHCSFLCLASTVSILFYDQFLLHIRKNLQFGFLCSFGLRGYYFLFFSLNNGGKGLIFWIYCCVYFW